jgi:hypothetical protein
MGRSGGWIRALIEEGVAEFVRVPPVLRKRVLRLEASKTASDGHRLTPFLNQCNLCNLWFLLL